MSIFGYIGLGVAILVNLPLLILVIRKSFPVLDWPVWVYRLAKRSRPWREKRATDLGGYLIILIIVMSLILAVWSRKL